MVAFAALLALVLVSSLSAATLVLCGGT